MPFQNDHLKISACPDLVTQLLKILSPTVFDSLLGKMGQFTLQPCLMRGYVKQRFDNYRQKSHN